MAAPWQAIIQRVKGRSEGGGMPNQVLVGGITGISQLVQANKAKKKAEANQPLFVDPAQAAMLSELDQKRKSIDTGSQYAAGMNSIDTTTASTANAITQNTGGDVGGTVAALIQNSRAAGQSKNQVLAQGANDQKYYTGMYGQLMGDIAQRKMELQLDRRRQFLAEWAQLRKKGSENLLGAITKASGPMSKNANQQAQQAVAQTPATSSQSSQMQNDMITNQSSKSGMQNTLNSNVPTSTASAPMETSVVDKPASIPMTSFTGK